MAMVTVIAVIAVQAFVTINVASVTMVMVEVMEVVMEVDMEVVMDGEKVESMLVETTTMQEVMLEQHTVPAFKYYPLLNNNLA